MQGETESRILHRRVWKKIGKYKKSDRDREREKTKLELKIKMKKMEN